MGKKKRSPARVPALERAYRVLERRFPVVEKGPPGVVLLGSDGLVLAVRGERTLLVRFWKGAGMEFRVELGKALKEAKVSHEVGPESDLEHKGARVQPPVVGQATPEAHAGASAEKPLSDAMMVARMSRSPHVRRCLLCKELVDALAGADEDEYTLKAAEAIERHAAEVPEPDNVACAYAGCVHHEDVPRALALKMIELGGGDKPWADVRGVKVSNIALRVREKDAPQGWDFTRQDVMQRHFNELVQSAADIYCRLGPKKTTIHVWVSPAYKSRREDVQDVPTLEDVLETFEKQVPVIKTWALAKYKGLKELAEMDLGLEEGEKK